MLPVTFTGLVLQGHPVQTTAGPQEASLLQARGQHLSAEVVFAPQLIEAHDVAVHLLVLHQCQGGQHEDAQLLCQVGALLRMDLQQGAPEGADRTAGAAAARPLVPSAPWAGSGLQLQCLGI